MELTEKIRALRQKRGFTQEALAAEIGVSAQAVSKWERGLALPDVTLLPELAVCFGVTLDELFGLSEEKEYDRIQNVLWDKRLLDHAEFDQAERWLDEKIAAGYRKADCHRLKADLYNHQADFLHQQAAEAAKAALAIDPDCEGALGELNTAMHGFIPDWCVRNHHKQIEYLQGFVRKHPKNWKAHMWLLDNLIDDRRFDEAEAVLKDLSRCDDTFRTPLYRGLLSRAEGKAEEAQAAFEKMAADFGDEWCTWFTLGDIAAGELRWDDAVSLYRKGIAKQKAPKYVDGFESIAQICEIAGNIPGAIAALEEELVVLKEDWNTEKGETADVVRREIMRLQKK